MGRAHRRAQGSRPPRPAPHTWPQLPGRRLPVRSPAGQRAGPAGASGSQRRGRGAGWERTGGRNGTAAGRVAGSGRGLEPISLSGWRSCRRRSRGTRGPTDARALGVVSEDTLPPRGAGGGALSLRSSGAPGLQPSTQGAGALLTRRPRNPETLRLKRASEQGHSAWQKRCWPFRGSAVRGAPAASGSRSHGGCAL